MALSQSDLDRLEKALVSNVLTVEVDGERVTYHSKAELLSAIAYVRGQLDAAGASRPVTQSYTVFWRD